MRKTVSKNGTVFFYTKKGGNNYDDKQQSKF